jgi:hypothetical protein
MVANFLEGRQKGCKIWFVKFNFTYLVVQFCKPYFTTHRWVAKFLEMRQKCTFATLFFLQPIFLGHGL